MSRFTCANAEFPKTAPTIGAPRLSTLGLLSLRPRLMPVPLPGASVHVAWGQTRQPDETSSLTIRVHPGNFNQDLLGSLPPRAGCYAHPVVRCPCFSHVFQGPTGLFQANLLC